MGLDTVELILEIEDEFDIVILEEEAEVAWTIGEMLNLVTRLTRAKGYEWSREEIRARIVKVVADLTGVHPLTLHDYTSFVSDLGLD